MSAALFYPLALVILLTVLGSRLPWTRTGGGILAALAVAWVGSRLVASPEVSIVDRREGWVVLVFAVVASVAAWRSLHQGQNPPPRAETERTARLRSLGVCAGIVAVLAAAWALPPDLPTPTEVPEIPWFFAGLGELSRWTGPFVALVLLPAIALACLLAAPHLDTRETAPRTRFHGRADEVLFFLFGWIFLGLLPILRAAWPGPPDASAPPIPLSRWFWIEVLSLPLPEPWLVRELPGLLLLVLLFGVLPWKLPVFKPTRGAFSRHRRRLGRAYWPACFLVALVVYVVATVITGSLLGVAPWIGGLP